MPPTNSQGSGNPSTPPQSIPLRDLSRPPDSADIVDGAQQHTRGRSLLSGGARPTSGYGDGPRYQRLGDTSPSPTHRNNLRPTVAPSLTTQGGRSLRGDIETPISPVGNPADFQAAMGFAGLLVPDISVSHVPRSRSRSYGSADFEGMGPYGGGAYGDSTDEHQHSYFPSNSDEIPLTDPDALQPVSGAPSTPGQRHDRSRSGSSLHTVNFDSPGTGQRTSRLGDDLHDVEAGLSPGSGRSRAQSYGASLAPDGRNRSRSPSNASGAFSRAGSIVRAMSQRVVNLSGEAELIEASARREAARQPNFSISSGTIGSLSDEDEVRFQPKHRADPLATPPLRQLPTAPIEKAMRFFGGQQGQVVEEEEEKPPNPLRGKSLGFFSAESRIRNKLCDILVYPLTEPLILILIIVQTIILAVDASKSVYTHPRPLRWGESTFDYALLGLFVVFTLELMARIIVSGFIFNAPEYSSVKREKGLKGIVLDKYHAVFKPQRSSSLRAPRNPSFDGTQTVVRSFTAIQTEGIRTVEQAQRLQLARRAFMRHSFNRLDFVAVVAFWIAFVLSIVGVEDIFHLFVFRMLSCLRILRLLALTHGTAVSLGFQF